MAKGREGQNKGVLQTKVSPTSSYSIWYWGHGLVHQTMDTSQIGLFSLTTSDIAFTSFLENTQEELPNVHSNISESKIFHSTSHELPYPFRQLLQKR